MLDKPGSWRKKLFENRRNYYDISFKSSTAPRAVLEEDAETTEEATAKNEETEVQE
ncbi:SpoVR family protein [Paenibacillus glacialis]|uniref:SpoVR family protein n=1 Tax=Paenibacillus glacialis TaxID=494026 RepID=UPI000B137412|nr:SpoVR family protein [Paenibacillus glacialis]